MKKSIGLLCFLFLPGLGLSQSFPAEEVSFSPGEFELMGTLTLPEGEGPHPAIVLISGSGAQDRDANLLGFPMFAIMANALNKAGLAVLRYDERGVGASKGPSVMESTTQDLAGDAQAAVRFLRNHPQIDSDRVGLLGHSEGGVIVPIVSVAIPEVSFLVLLAGYGVPGAEMTAEQTRLTLAAAGMPEAYQEAMAQYNVGLFDRANNPDVDADSLKVYAVEGLLEAMMHMPTSIQASIPDKKAFAEQQAAGALQQVDVPWLRYYFGYDPIPTLEQVTCPVLMIFGSKDQQVTPAQNRAPMMAALRKAGNESVTYLELNDANHLFQKAKTGAVSEYASLEKEFTPLLLPLISAWLQGQVE